MGGYGLKVSHDYTWQWSSGPKDEGIWPQAGGVIISTGPDEFIVAGGGIIVTFAPVGSQAMVGITEIREGEFKTGKWVPGGQLNGDQSHQGRHLRLPGGDFGIQRIKLYKYY
jgi:beta-galactosidase GanA